MMPRTIHPLRNKYYLSTLRDHLLYLTQHVDSQQKTQSTPPPPSRPQTASHVYNPLRHRPTRGHASHVHSNAPHRALLWFRRRPLPRLHDRRQRHRSPARTPHLAPRPSPRRRLAARRTCWFRMLPDRHPRQHVSRPPATPRIRVQLHRQGLALWSKRTGSLPTGHFTERGRRDGLPDSKSQHVVRRRVRPRQTQACLHEAKFRFRPMPSGVGEPVAAASRASSFHDVRKSSSHFPVLV